MSPSLPAFRRDLNVVASFRAGAPVWLVEDPRTGSVVTLGEEEHLLCSLLDGRAGAEEVLAAFRERLGRDLPAGQLEAFLHQVGWQGLLEGEGRPSRSRTLPELFDPETFLVLASFPLRGGARALDRLARRASWFFTWPPQVPAGLAILSGILVMVHAWDDFVYALWAAWGPGFLLLLIALSSLLCRSARSLAHGIICRRYKRSVPEVGFALVYLVLPSFYCDWWSDVAWIRDKRRRLWIVFAGLYFQACLWAVATLGWWLSRPHGPAATFWLALSAASFVTLVLLSANPLVQGEGYLLLADWLEVPRLRERSLATFGALLYGRPAPEPLTRRQRTGFVLFGGVVFLYALLMIGLHVYLAWAWLSDTYEGPGAVVSVLLILFLFQKPIRDLLARQRPVRWLADPRAPVRRWAAAVLASALVAGLLVLPFEYHAGGPVQLLPVRRAEVRTDLEGVVERILVREGDWVEPGRTLARLSRRGYQRDLRVAQADLEQHEADLRLLEAGPRPERVEEARRGVETAWTRLAWSRPRAERYAALYRRGLVSEQEHATAAFQRELDERRLAEARAAEALARSGARAESVLAARAEIHTARAVLESSRVEVERTDLVSPIAGRVVGPGLETLEGRFLEAGRRDLLLEVQDGRTLVAEIVVPEEDLAGVSVGSEVAVAVWAFHDRTFSGRIASIAPVAGAQTGPRSVRVATEIPNGDGLLKPGMTGYAKIAVGRRPGWYLLLGPLIRWSEVKVWYWLP